MPHRKPELERIIKDLERFIKTTCEYDPEHPKHPHDFVGEKCNEVVLMLQGVRDELDKQVKEEKK